MRGVAAIFVAAMLFASAVPVMAGHGHPFRIPGTACAEPPLGCFASLLEWSGGGIPGGSGTYRLTLWPSDVDDAALKFTILGREEFRGLEGGGTPTCIWFETFDYRGSDLATGGDVFEVEGPISNCLNEDVYHGTLRGHFLDFALTFAFPNPEPEVR